MTCLESRFILKCLIWRPVFTSICYKAALDCSFKIFEIQELGFVVTISLQAQIFIYLFDFELVKLPILNLWFGLLLRAPEAILWSTQFEAQVKFPIDCLIASSITQQRISWRLWCIFTDCLESVRAINKPNWMPLL